MRLYYAHSLRIYGKAQERRELRQIRHLLGWCFKIVNPRKAIPQDCADPMAMCLDLVRQMNILVFSEYEGYIGRGVYQEVCLALELGIMTWFLRNGKFYPRFDIVASNLDWVRYARVLVKE